jgi:hypothetical protein
VTISWRFGAGDGQLVGDGYVDGPFFDQDLVTPDPSRSCERLGDAELVLDYEDYGFGLTLAHGQKSR